jgi:hypothetical protein
MKPTLRWELCVALGAGAVLAVVAALFPPVEGQYDAPPWVQLFMSGIGYPGEALGELWNARWGVTVAKLVADWLVYATLVFLPFRVESLLVRAEDPLTDSRIFEPRSRCWLSR